MPVKQSAYMKGNARTPQPTAHKAGVPHVLHFTHTFTETVNTTDILELFILPAYSRIDVLRINSENIATTNFAIGLMSGTPFSLDPARTVGTQYFAAAAAGTEVQASAVALGVLAASDEHRSVGLVPSANIAAAGNKRLHVYASMSA